MKAVCFRNSFQHFRGQNILWHTVFLMKQHFTCVCGTVSRHSHRVWAVKILVMLVNMRVIYPGVSVLWALMKNKVTGLFFFFFWRTYCDLWRFSGYDGKHCFVSCSYGTVFQSDGAPLHLSSRVRACLDRTRRTGRGGANPWPFHSPLLTPRILFSGCL